MKGKYKQIDKPTIQSEKKEVVMTTAGKKSACKNCKRIKAIQARGMCGLCNNAIKGLVEDTQEYNAALEDAKERAKTGMKKERSQKQMPVKNQKQLPALQPGALLKARTGIVHPDPQKIPVVLALSIVIDVQVKGISAAL